MNQNLKDITNDVKDFIMGLYAHTMYYYSYKVIRYISGIDNDAIRRIAYEHGYTRKERDHEHLTYVTNIDKIRPSKERIDLDRSRFVKLIKCDPVSITKQLNPFRDVCKNIVDKLSSSQTEFILNRYIDSEIHYTVNNLSSITGLPRQAISHVARNGGYCRKDIELNDGLVVISSKGKKLLTNRKLNSDRRDYLELTHEPSGVEVITVNPANYDIDIDKDTLAVCAAISDMMNDYPVSWSGGITKLFNLIYPVEGISSPATFSPQQIGDILKDPKSYKILADNHGIRLHIKKNGNAGSIYLFEQQYTIDDTITDDIVIDDKIVINHQEYSCPSCGKVIDLDSKFCKYCGDELQSVSSKFRRIFKLVDSMNSMFEIADLMYIVEELKYALTDLQQSFDVA